MKRRYVNTDLKTGDSVRSFDFEQSDYHYFEGIINRITDNQTYEILVSKQVWDGVEVEPRHKRIYPPINGLQNWMGGRTKGVQLIK